MPPPSGTGSPSLAVVADPADDSDTAAPGAAAVGTLAGVTAPGQPYSAAAAVTVTTQLIGLRGTAAQLEHK